MKEKTGMMQNKQNRPYVIGVMGGVGSGKSELLNYLKQTYHAEIFEADIIAKQCMDPETACMQQIRQQFPESLFYPDGSIHKEKMADYIFHNPQARVTMNQIVHPTVVEWIIRRIEQLQPDVLAVIESAIMIEAGLDRFCDELWYVYTDQDIRSERLNKSRGYSLEKTKAIIDSQLSEEEYRNRADAILNNNSDLEHLKKQIDELLQSRER
ncbi:MAG: dephospho-CoA kinase [Lachnospiraceae bacterium]|nr:dephospho-CoA kinase [Lachnospiraceae bacterium]